MHDSAVATPSRLAPPLSLQPFRAWRLSAAQLGDPASARAFARPYRKVNQRLREWQKRGMVAHDDVPGLYLHEYTSGGLTVRGVVGCLDLARRGSADQPHVVLPHEGVHLAQAADLGRRMHEMRLNPAPILLVRHGAGRTTALLADLLEQEPLDRSEDRGGQSHRVWQITDPALVSAVNDDLAGAEALVADGHHRLAAYLDLQQAHPGSGWDCGLAMVVDQDDTPLHLGAIHRVADGISWSALHEAVAREGGSFLETDRADALSRLGRHTLVGYDGHRWASLDLPVAADDLAVCVLHESVLPALGDEPRLTYHHTVQDALHRAESDDGSIALLLPTPEFDVVLRHVRSDRLLPEKATSFQPKPHVGSLMRSVAGG